MWKKIIMNLKEKTIHFFPVSILLYLSFTHIIPRNTYNFVKEEYTDLLKPTILPTLETQRKMKLRKKVMQDLTYHKIRSNWNAQTITKVSINSEGKIVGYKIYKAFYPNYFTKTQIANMLKKATKVTNKNSNLHTIKITFDIMEETLLS
jgi:uncharacterized membrane protein YeiB